MNDELTMQMDEQAGTDPQAGFDAGAVEEDRPGENAAAESAKTHSEQEFNSAMAATRRRAERETEERMRLQTDSEIAGYRIPNPWKPGTFFTSKKDLEEYSTRLRAADARRRAKDQNKSVEEVLEDDADRAFVRQQRAAARQAEEASKRKAEQDRFIAADVEDFQRRYPGVDIVAVDQNASFRKFVGSRYGKEPLANLWGDYVALVGDAKVQATIRQAGSAARSSGSGSGSSGGTLTASQRAALQEWNKDHPEMAMTEKEFLER